LLSINNRITTARVVNVAAARFLLHPQPLNPGESTRGTVEFDDEHAGGLR
jgi:hypothetical protein